MSWNGKMNEKKHPDLRPKVRFPEFEADGAWHTETIGEISKPIKEKVKEHKITPVSITAGVGFVPQSDKFGRDISGEQYKNYTYLRRGDFAYNKGNSKSFPQGYVCQLHEFDEVAASSAFICFKLKDGFEPTFIKGLFDQNTHGRQLAAHITSGARSNGLLNLNASQFYSVQLPFPPKIDEQERIAECITSIEALIQAETEKLDALKDHKQGLIFELFPIKGETLPNRRFPDFQDPEGWVEKPLGEIADYENGKAYEKDIEEDGDFVVVNARFISTDGEVRKYSNARYCIASKGDVLMVLSDLPKGRALAKCFFVDKDEKYAVNQRVSRITAHSIDSAFLYYALDRHPFLLAFNDGLNQTHLSKGSVLECPIAFPLDEKEQAKIVATLKTVDEQIRSQAEEVKGLKDHKQGLLQQLFPILDEVDG